MIEQIESPETKQTIARKILEGLRDWFEVDESREKYILDCVNWIFLAAKEKDEYVGFLCLKETGKETVELAVMGVQKEFHRKGLGRQLFDSAKKIAIEKGYSFMQVKTVQMGVYPDYDISSHSVQSFLSIITTYSGVPSSSCFFSFAANPCAS